MPHDLSRRELLRQGAGLGAGLGLAALAPGCALMSRGPGEGWFGISLAQWSLHRALFAGELDTLDFAPHARREFGLEAVEYVNLFFKERVTDWPWLREMRDRAEDAGVSQLLIMIDGEGELGAPDEEQRLAAVRNHAKWISTAAFLGCHSVRVNAAGSGPREAVAGRVADSLHRLAEHASHFRMNVIVENHGGHSSDGAWLAGVIRSVQHPHVGTLPDFGNFRFADGTEYDRYQGVSELMPFARAVSAKSYDFDEGGEETTIDYLRMLTIVRDAGYRGWVGVEYEGDRLSEPDGIRATKALLERVRDELA
jgi:sugar phosphate isomerase/epimerase